MVKAKYLTASSIKRGFATCRNASLEISGYATAIFLAELIVKVWTHH